MASKLDLLPWAAPDAPVVAIGWDQSINHAAAVGLADDGRIAALSVLCTRVSDAKALHASDAAPMMSCGVRLPGHLLATGKLDPAVRDVRRLLWLRQWMVETCTIMRRNTLGLDTYVAVEDYGYNTGHEAYGTGQVGGLLRTVIMDRGCPLRLHDPTSVKLWATGRGNADKVEVRNAVRDVHGVDFLAVGLSDTDSSDAAAGDLADAYVLARMALGEVHVRAGRRSLQDLTDGERRVFLRVTKTYPTNLLDRPWTTAGED
jgi:hypothetical protein